MKIPDNWLQKQILIPVYSEAVRLAQSKHQVIGEKGEYYITLNQLESILYKQVEGAK